jgi:hypothetical protein
MAGGRFLKPVQQPQQRGFACPVGANNAQNTARRDMK